MFTQQCFIRKNAEQLIYRLYKLGYEYYRPIDRFKNICTNFGKNVDFDGNESDRYLIDAFDDGYLYYFNKNMIDCGTNEELFLAIAALRDDADRFQWFTNDVFWIKCSQIDLKNELDNNYEEFCVADFHKATVSELIEHFKK